MAKAAEKIPVYLEVGSQKVFAGAVEWPGWSMHGQDEAAALQALLDFGPRYAEMLKGKRLGFVAPKTVDAFKVVERVKGNAATDFGAPNIPPKVDNVAVSAADLKLFQKIIAGAWTALREAAKGAEGHELRKGPRGGGRELDGILEHVLGAQSGYLGSLGWKFKPADGKQALEAATAELEAAMLEGVAASARGEIPAVGPRGGKRWPPRYFVRRSVWHIVDHFNEIEQRLVAE